MIGPYSPLYPQVYEGAFASLPLQANLERNFPSVLCGAGGFVSCSPLGTLQGRFGWGDITTRQVNNARLNASDSLGVVIPLERYGPTWQYYDRSFNAYRIRAGLNMTLMAQGNFWLRFAGGAYAGQPVYASLVDGSALSGETDGAELTPWFVCSNAGPGRLAMVSTYAKFGA